MYRLLTLSKIKVHAFLRAKDVDCNNLLLEGDSVTYFYMASWIIHIES